jgi:SP family galactose:H+ symporter-like MFS transporter
VARSAHKRHIEQEPKSKRAEHPAGKKQNYHSSTVYVFAIVAALGTLLFGYDTGLIAGAELYLRKDFSLNPITEELVVSSILIGGLVGAGVSGKLSNALGRKWSLIIVAIIFAIGAILTTFASNWEIFVAFRILVGFCVGVASMVTPVYITEISPPSKRGVLVTFSKFTLNCAIPVAYGLDLAFAHWRLGWRPMFAVECIPGIILAIGMFFLPNTPRWLASKGRWEKAGHVLERIAGPKKDEEMRSIRSALAVEKRASLRELFVTGLRMALVVGVGLAIFQQLIGSGAIGYYAPTIFKSAGFKSPAGDILATISTAIDNTIATIVALFLLDRLGRRPLLLVSLIGITVTLVMMGIIFIFGASTTAAYLILICLLVYIFAYGIGIGPIFALMCSEIFPTRLRGDGVSISFCFNWAATLLVSITFLSLIRHLGSSLTYWLYALLAVAAVIFCWFLVPETKGKSLEQIEKYWENGRQW